MSDKDLNDSWDWSGPHCNKCGCTGIDMFSEVMKDKPVISGRAFLNLMDKFKDKNNDNR